MHGEHFREPALARQVTAAFADRLGGPHRRGPARHRPVAPGRRAHLLQRRPPRTPGELGTPHGHRHRAVPRRRRRSPPGNALARAGRRACEGDRTAGRPHPGRIPVLQRRERSVRHLHRGGRPRSPGTARPATGRRAGLPCRVPPAGPEELVETVYSDALFRMPSQKLAEANAAAGGTSYLFELSWVAPALGGILGACHSLDVPLAFGTLDTGRHPAHRRGASSRGRRALPRTPGGMGPLHHHRRRGLARPPARRAPHPRPGHRRRLCPTPNRHPARSDGAERGPDRADPRARLLARRPLLEVRQA